MPCKKSSKEIRCFHSGVDEDSGLLGCSAVLLFPDLKEHIFKGRGVQD